MTPPSAKLAASLSVLRSLQERGVVAVSTRDLPRTHRERLVRNGFLLPVMKGWYVAGAPDRPAGDSTAWYASFWRFCAGYLRARFGEAWCLSPEQSLALHAGNRTVPGQLLVRAPRGRNRVTDLLHGTSLLEVRAAMPAAGDVAEVDGMRAFRPGAALVACPARFFREHAVDARAALALVRDASDLLPRLLDGGHATIAGRLVAAFRDVGRDEVANEIVDTMRAADFGVRGTNPFAGPPPARPVRPDASPLVQRLRLTWDAMRGRVLAGFPGARGGTADVDALLARIEDVYVTDAYHSLSIEGYRVSPTLIGRVRAGDWNPDHHAADRGHRDALAARGYWLARGDEVDFGIKALDRNLREVNADVTALAAPGARAPTLMPAYVDLWSQTKIRRLSLYPLEHEPCARRCRGCPSAALRPAESLVPARAAEMVEVPLWSARAWLDESQNREQLTSVSDVAERGVDEAANETGGSERPAFRWAGADDPRTGRVTPDALRPGDVLVVPADYGGCDEFGWAPTSDRHVADPASDNRIKRVTDVADEAARPFRSRRHTVRVARDVVAEDGEWDRLREIIADEGLSGREMAERLLSALPAERSPELPDKNEGDSRVRAVREPLEALLHRCGRSGIVAEFPYADGRSRGVALVAPRGVREPGPIDRAKSGGAPATEDDRLSHTATKPVSIDTHTCHVVANVNRFIQVLGDAVGPVANDLKLAAFLHDAGKADPRFQNLLSGGDPWNRPAVGLAMAKSGRQSPKDARERAGLPNGWRHEALSVRMALAHPRFAEADDPALVLWLIGTHHGFGRPFFEFADPHETGSGHDDVLACLGVERWRLAAGPGPQSMAFDFDGADWAAIYERLKQRYGVWGLAHLEATLRLADHRASESEQDDA